MGNVLGPNHDASLLLRADEATRRLLENAATWVRPGQSSDEIRKQLLARARRMGVERHWHRPIVRVGADTLLGFRDAPNPERRLTENDLCFIDIGPVWNGHEGDRGCTFMTGEDSAMQRLAQASRDVWQHACEAWQRAGLEGRDIYAIVRERARASGYVQREDVRGHRIGDWPHGRYVRGPLATSRCVPEDGLWILEVHLLDKALGLGAFHEAPLSHTPPEPRPAGN